LPADLVQRLEQQPKSAAPRHILLMQKESMPLSAQVRHPGPVWLDRLRAEELAPYGFGAELRRMIDKRREVVRGVGIRPDDPNKTEQLVALEMRAVGKRISEATGQRLLDVPPPGFRGHVKVVSVATRHPTPWFRTGRGSCS